MSAITDITRSRITASLEVFLENYVEKYRNRTVEKMQSPQHYLTKSDKGGALKPFYAAILPSEVLRISAFQRGVVTGLGTSLEECARLISLDHHEYAQRGYEIYGDLSSGALAEIERQVAKYEYSKNSETQGPHLDAMVESVLHANINGDFEPRRIIADLYILAEDGVEYFFEMKSPKPNKDQCLRMTHRILQTHALRNKPRPNVMSYFAMAYNPFGQSRKEYNWSMARIYTPFNDAVLIGAEFWNIVGGPTTYEELLEIYFYVGAAKRKFIVDALAFDF